MHLHVCQSRVLARHMQLLSMVSRLVCCEEASMSKLLATLPKTGMTEKYLLAYMGWLTVKDTSNKVPYDTKECASGVAWH